MGMQIELRIGYHKREKMQDLAVRLRKDYSPALWGNATSAVTKGRVAGMNRFICYVTFLLLLPLGSRVPSRRKEVAKSQN